MVANIVSAEFVRSSLGVFSLSLGNQPALVDSRPFPSVCWLTLQLNPYESLNYRFWLDMRWQSEALRYSLVRLEKGRFIIRLAGCSAEPDELYAQLTRWADQLEEVKAIYIKSRR